MLGYAERTPVSESQQNNVNEEVSLVPPVWSEEKDRHWRHFQMSTIVFFSQPYLYVTIELMVRLSSVRCPSVTNVLWLNGVK